MILVSFADITSYVNHLVVFVLGNKVGVLLHPQVDLLDPDVVPAVSLLEDGLDPHLPTSDHPARGHTDLTPSYQP